MQLFNTFSTTTTVRELRAFCKEWQVTGYSAYAKEGKAALLAYVNEWIVDTNAISAESERIAATIEIGKKACQSLDEQLAELPEPAPQPQFSNYVAAGVCLVLAALIAVATWLVQAGIWCLQAGIAFRPVYEEGCVWLFDTVTEFAGYAVLGWRAIANGLEVLYFEPEYRRVW